MAPKTLSHRPGRGGITIDTKGTEATLGFWPEEFDAATGWVGQLRGTFGEAVKIAQRHHQQNRHIIESKVTRNAPQLPEPDVRVKLARTEQKKLADLHKQVAKVADEAFLQVAALKPFDWEQGGMIDAMRRHELRQTLLKMKTPEERMVAMRKLEYRRAALEQPAETSGIAPSAHAELYKEEIAAKFPDKVAGSEQAMQAVEIVQQALKTANTAVSNELVAAGSSVVEAPEPTTPKAWA